MLHRRILRKERTTDVVSSNVIRLLLPLLLLTLSIARADDRPNIVLIMVDDMGWSDIGCYGSEIDTPNIDRLAAEGVLWTDFYNNGKCTTTRASLLTGLYPRKGGKGSEMLDESMVTLGEALKLQGYQTGLSGKWHNGSKAPHRPFDRGFDKSYGLWDGCCNFFDPSLPDPKFKGGRSRFFGEDDRRITDFPDDFFTTDAFTDHALATIRDQVGKGKPFLHYLPHTAPHYPLHAKPEDIAKYKGRYDAGWEVLRQRRYARQLELGIIDAERFPDPGMNSNNKTWEQGKNDDLEWELLRMETYAAMVDSVDQSVGRVMALLEELGVADNTLVIFLSDNGACAESPGGDNNTEHRPGPKQWYSHVGPNWAWAQNSPWRYYKAHAHEGGVASPCVMRWPAKIPAGTKNGQVGHIIDFLPTFLAMAGGQYPKTHSGSAILPQDGIDLLPAITEEASTFARPEPLFWHWSGHAAVRDGDWKLVRYKKSGAWELYDLSSDRTETKDLAAGHPERVAEMAKAWQTWAKMTGVAK